MGTVVGLVFEEAEKFPCPHCDKEYKSAEALEKHIKDKHSDNKSPEKEPEN